MGFPDRIERTVEIAHPPERVWAAITTAEGLGTWFGERAADRPSPRRLGPDEVGQRDAVDLRVERVEEPSSVRVHLAGERAARGRPAPDLRRVHPRTRRRGHPARPSSQSGFAQLPEDAHGKAFGGNTRGWAHEIGELAAYLDAA